MIEKAGSSVTSVALAIERASAQTGADFDYLMKTAARESSFDPSAKARSSSAAGLFQFIEQTWLGLVKNHGDDHGLGTLADQISRGRNGRYVVADRQARREILALRYDPTIAAVMAGEFTKESEAALRGAFGREPTGGELYAAHFLGSEGAIELIQAAQRGEASAAALFPDAARANRSIFYTKGGAARSPGEVLAQLQSKHDNADMPDAPAVADGVMLARIRGSMDSMDDVVSDGFVAARAGRPASDEEDYPDYIPLNDLVYTAANKPSVVTPFMAQLLASLDPIPDRARDAVFRAERETWRTVDEAA
jgi:hypothetical protein